ncbi:hypothetical protein M2317_000072 [Microbacterium sp. ZKA21]|uniref:phage tail protein n=1 Tax=Microbacterium sp. ZKA21 TaxID=3381694 RepID=UPI003D214B6E
MAGQNIVISVLADTKKLSSGLKDASGALGGLGKAAATGAKVAVGALAAVGVAAAGIGIKAVSSASSLEQAMGAMSSVFKDSTGQMTEWANGAASSVGLAKSEYAGLATTLGSQLKNMGVEQVKLGGQTNDLIGLGADLAAQFGGSTADAVGALSSLLRGERDPIERYGVSINEAAVKARLAEMGLNGLSGEAEKNAKLTATLALLYDQTADAQGAFSRESTTLAGSQQRLAAGTENLYATLGTSLLPAVTAVTAALGSLINQVQESAAFQAFTGWLTDASNSFADFIFSIINGEASLGDLDLAGFLTRAIPKMFAARDQMITGLLDAMPGIIEGIAAALPGIVQTIATSLTTSLALIVPAITAAAPALLLAGVQLFLALVQSIVTVLPQLIATVVGLIPQLATTLIGMIPALLAAAITLFQSLIQAVVTILPQLLTQILGMLPALLESVLGMIPAILDAAVQLFTMLVDAIPLILPPLVDAIIETLPKLVETIVSMLPKILEAAIDLFMALVDSLPIILPQLITAVIDLLPVVIESLLGLIPELIDAAITLFLALVEAVPKIIGPLLDAIFALLPEIVGALIDMIPDLVQAGVDLIGGLVKGLWDAASSVGSALLDIAQDAIGGFLEFLGIHSPSRLFAGYGKNLVQGLVGGLDGNRGMFAKSLDGLAGMAADFSPDPLTMAPAGALTAQTVQSAPDQVTEVAGPAVVDLSASSAQLLARLIADGLTVILPGAALAGSVGAHNVTRASRSAA